MADFQKRKRIKSILYSNGMLLVVLILLVVLGSAAYGMYGKFEETREKKTLAADKLKELEQEKSSLETSIQMLGTDEGIEAVIRNKFRAAKEGEGLVVIVDKDENNATDAKSSKGLWGFLKGLVGK